MTTKLSAFRLGDVRGLYPDEIDETFIQRFAHAFVGHFSLDGRIATGRDMRASSKSLQDALNATLAAIGIEVIDLGLCPTELGYFCSGSGDIEAAIIVTASHNPASYNGLKCVLKGGHGITYETGLQDIEFLMQKNYQHPGGKGSITCEDYHARYLDFLGQRFAAENLISGQVALNGLNGTAATMADRIAAAFDLPVSWFRKEPGPMPSNGADPADAELASEMSGFMQQQDFQLGVAWDGDCDRCVFFDNNGIMVPTYYIIGILAERFLEKSPGAAIVFDTKLCWNTLDIISKYDGRPVPSLTGHAFMKQKMQESGAVYGGELSSHHYYGDFHGCDSGMITWLTVLEMLNIQSSTIAELVEDRRQQFCCTPEISLSLLDADAAFAHCLDTWSDKALEVDHFDGLSFTMPGNWRFSLRESKTESLVRLNFEAKGNVDILMEEGHKVLGALARYRADDSDWAAEFRIQ
jgi:phosphomannomutase